MASIAEVELNILERERRFFLAMALLLAVTAAIGFGYFKFSGKGTNLYSPWWVHVHSITMIGWLGFFVLQNSLIVSGNVMLHRRLGMFGAFYAGWIVFVGMVLGWAEVAAHRGGFTPPDSMALNWMNILTFIGLFIAAFRLRQRSDWHKRLMLCALIILTAPAYGRILILLGVRTNTNFTLFILAYVAIAAFGDLAIRKRLHPAYLWGFIAAGFMGTMIGVLPLLKPFVAFAEAVAG